MNAAKAAVQAKGKEGNRPRKGAIPSAPVSRDDRLSGWFASLLERLDIKRAVLLICLLASLAYANSLGGTFVFDDIDQIVENPSIHSWSNLGRAFTTHVWAFRERPETLRLPPPPPYYRPLFTGILTVEYHLFGLWPQGWHLVSVLLYMLCAVGLFYVLLLASGKRSVALGAASLFAVFPIHSESVSWISGITDPLFGVFFLASLSFYLRFRATGQRRLLILSLLAYALSALSKETALSLVLLIFVYELIEMSIRSDRPHIRTRAAGKGSGQPNGSTPAMWSAAVQAARCTGPYLVVTLAYLIARFLALGGLTWNNPNAHQGPFVDTVLTLPLVISTYFLHLIWPIDLSVMYKTHYVTSGGLPEFLIPATMLGIATGLLVFWRRRISREVWLALGLLIVPLLPVLDLRQISEEYLVSDRYLFLPAAGWCYLVALGVSRLSSAKESKRAKDRSLGARPPAWRSRLAAAAMLFLLAGYTFASARENSHWSDAYSLWSQAARIRPNCWQAHYNTGLALIDMKRFPEARDALERAAALAPDEPWIYDALGRVFAAMGDRPGAIASFQRSLDLDPDMFESLNNLGTVYFDGGNYKQAEALFASALRLRPQAVNARYNLGLCHSREGKFTEAISELQKVVDSAPIDTEARFGLASAYEKAGRIPEALAALELGLPMAKTVEVSRRFSNELDRLRTLSK